MIIYKKEKYSVAWDIGNFCFCLSRKEEVVGDRGSWVLNHAEPFRFEHIRKTNTEPMCAHIFFTYSSYQSQAPLRLFTCSVQMHH